VYPEAVDAEYVRGIAGQFWPASLLPASTAEVELRIVLAEKPPAVVGGPATVAAMAHHVDDQIADEVAEETRAAEARQRKMNALFDRAATR
jgi:hypothetical protein